MTESKNKKYLKYIYTKVNSAYIYHIRFFINNCV